jgi:hypothetical protein
VLPEDMGKVWVLLPAQDKWDGKADCSGARSGEVDGCGFRYTSGGPDEKVYTARASAANWLLFSTMWVLRLLCPWHISANLPCELLVKRVRF